MPASHRHNDPAAPIDWRSESDDGNKVAKVGSYGHDRDIDRDGGKKETDVIVTAIIMR